MATQNSSQMLNIAHGIDLRYLAAGAVVFWLLLQAYNHVVAYRRLSHIPGPRLAGWTNFWWLHKALSRRGHEHLYEALRDHGPLVRIAPNLLVTGDTEYMRKMNAVRSPYLRSDWNKAFRFDADREHVFSEADPKKHLELRNKLSSGYSGKENPNLESEIDVVVMKMVDLIKSKYISKGSEERPVDMGQIIQYLALDIITAVGLGRAFGWLDDEDKYEYLATMEANLPIMNFTSALPLTRKIIGTPSIQRMILPSVKDRTGLGKIKAVVQGIVRERFAESAEKRGGYDMTQSFIDRGLTEDDMLDNAILQILAGSDTTGTVMRAFMVFVTSNRKVYQRLQDEVTSTKTPLDEIIPYADAHKLPYLAACLKETMRYWPVNTGLMPKVVGPEGDTYKGMYLPPGTEVGGAAWMLYRHNPIYGVDCGSFRPERWLDSTPEQLASMERDHELVFASGKFRCLGDRLAMIELEKTIFELFRRFDFSITNPMKPLRKVDNYSLWCMRGLMMRVEDLHASE